MLEETYYVGAYWGVRQETVSECARRVELFFHLLAQCDASFGQWYQSGRGSSSSQGLALTPHDPAALENVLLQGRNRTDLHKQVIDDLGYSLRVRNQLPEGSATNVSIRCGVYTEAVSNTCLLEPPTEGETAERIGTLPTLIQVLTCMVTAWDPDWGVINSNRALMELAPEASQSDTNVGWVTYLARRRGIVPLLPAPVRIEPLSLNGTLVILTPERFTTSNPEHMQLGRRVRGLLDRASLLKPRPA
ncbi:Imm52 family immunity protein [Hyalangium versicolor]|uniref:Imm52 family immunity protein n=1 Tax=Hyalangium versicolor TaxID=2861190 RepID=UPI001CCA2DC3|nr:Imm52 family immunity protein [Hyalangium versicolor]